MRYVFAVLAFMLAFGSYAKDSKSGSVTPDEAQQEIDFEEQWNDTELQMRNYIEEINSLTTEIQLSSGSRLKQISRSLGGIDARWATFYSINQEFIADDDSLMAIVAEYQEIKQMVTDSIASQSTRLEQIVAFRRAELFIGKQDSTYAKFARQAKLYSLTPQTAKQLEKVKAQEQMVFATIEQLYATAQASSQANPSLKYRMKALEEKYVELKSLSAEIQSAEYKPWLDRAKDYLYSLAAVSIVLMLINMIATRIKGYKDAKESAKKMREMLKKAEGEYPEI